MTTVKITIEAGNVRAEQEFRTPVAEEQLSATATKAIRSAAADFHVHIPEVKNESPSEY